MRKRSTEILEKLILSNSKSMEVKKLITTYRISLKTLRTDVNEINDFLLEAKMSPTKLNEKRKADPSGKRYHENSRSIESYGYLFVQNVKRRKTDLHHCRVADESRLYNNAKSCKEIKC